MGSERNKKKGRGGFTLIELLIVVAILAALAAIAVPSYFTYIDKARLTTSVSTLTSLRTEMESYHTENGLYPTAIDFTNYTDQNNKSILTSMTAESFKGKIASWQTYTTTGDTYALTAKAVDSKNTLLTLTPMGITY